MRTRPVPRPVLVLVVVAVVAAVPAVALGPGPQAAIHDGAGENTTGVQLTAYMQSTAEETNATVETGLWIAGIERSSNPEDDIRDRAEDLEARLDRLRNRTESLNRSRENGSLPPVVYNARASALEAQVTGLREAVEETAETANQYGVNVSKLDTLRANASNLSGPEVAAIARNLTTRGPPSWAGNGTTGPPGAENNRTGPPENPGQSGDGGPPENDTNATSSDDGNSGNAPGPDAPGPEDPGPDAPGPEDPGSDAPGPDDPGSDAPGQDAPDQTSDPDNDSDSDGDST